MTSITSFILVTALLFARQQRADGLRDYVQSTLVFDPPLVGFGLQAALVQNFEYGLAWSAFGLGVLYLLLWLGLRNTFGVQFKILNDAFLLLGLGFVSLAVLAPQMADAIFRGLFGFTLNFSWFALGPFGFMHPNTPGVWTAMSWGLIPVLLLSWVGSARHWPFAERFGHAATYRGWVASGLGVFLMGWMFIVHGLWVTDPVMGAGWAQPAQIGYLPLFNALDFVSALALFALWRHGRLAGAYSLNSDGARTQQALHWLMGATAFVWLNAMIARSLNAYAGLPLDDGRFLHESLAQTTYAIA